MSINPARAVRRLLPLAAATLLLAGCGVLTDSTAPVVSVTFVPGSAETGTPPTATASAQDPESGITSLKLFRVENGTEILLSETSGSGEAGSEGGEVAAAQVERGALVTATLEVGVYELVAEATNGVGRTSRDSKLVDLSTGTGVPDDTAPLVNITSITPKAGSAVGREPLAIAYVAQDNSRLEHVTLYVSVNGGEFGLLALHETVQSFASGAFQVDASAFALGQSLRFRVTAKDVAGNESSVESELLTVTDTNMGPDPDTQAPTVTAYGLSPVTAGQIERGQLTLHYMAQDNRELVRVVLEHSINGGDFEPVNPDSVRRSFDDATFAEGSFSIDASRYQYGDEVEFRVVAVDRSSNRGEHLLPLVTVASVADSAPALTLSSITPSVNGFLNLEPVTVNFFVDDDEGVRSVDLYVVVDGERQPRSDTAQNVGRGYSGSLTADLNGPQFTYGQTIEFVLEAEDEGGNVTTVTSPAYTLADRELPKITFLSPLEQFKGTHASVAFTATDNDEVASVVLVINARIIHPFEPLESGYYQYSWDVGTEPFGLHTLTAIVTDVSGNIATDTLVVSLVEEED